MQRTRRLVLKREALTELTSSELGDVAGGTVQHTVPCTNTRVCPVTQLVSALMECPTNPGCPDLTAPNCTGTCTTTVG